jgi:hypothetical protein
MAPLSESLHATGNASTIGQGKRRVINRECSRQHTTSPYHLPAIGKNIADQANRAGVAERFHDPAVQQTIEVDLALITSDDALRRDLALSLVNTAQQHEAHTL